MLMYRNTDDFGTLILYLATLLNRLLAFIVFVDSLGFSMCKRMSSANGHSLRLFSPVQMPFSSLASYLGWPEPQHDGERCPCIVPVLRGKAFSLPPTEVFPDALYRVEGSSCS